MKVCVSSVEETQRGRICMLRIAKALYAWGAVDIDERIPRLKEALDKAVESPFNQKGTDVK